MLSLAATLKSASTTLKALTRSQEQLFWHPLSQEALAVEQGSLKASALAREGWSTKEPDTTSFNPAQAFLAAHPKGLKSLLHLSAQALTELIERQAPSHRYLMGHWLIERLEDGRNRVAANGLRNYLSLQKIAPNHPFTPIDGSTYLYNETAQTALTITGNEQVGYTLHAFSSASAAPFEKHCMRFEHLFKPSQYTHGIEHETFAALINAQPISKNDFAALAERIPAITLADTINQYSTAQWTAFVQDNGISSLLGSQHAALRKRFMFTPPTSWLDHMADDLGLSLRQQSSYLHLTDLWMLSRSTDKDCQQYILPAIRQAHPEVLGHYNDAQLLALWRSCYGATLEHLGRNQQKAKPTETINYDKPLSPNKMRSLLVERFGKPVIEALESHKKLFLLDNANTLPDNIKARHSSVLNRVAGLTTPDNVVYLIGNQINEHTLPGIFLHEVGEHASLSKMLGPDYSRLTRHFSRLLKQGDHYAVTAAQRVPAQTPAQHIPSERLAYLIEAVANDQVAHEQGQEGYALGQQALSNLRVWLFRTPTCQWLEDIGALDHFTLRPEDLVTLAKQSVASFAQSLDPSIQAPEQAPWQLRLSPKTLDNLFKQTHAQRIETLSTLPPNQQIAYLYGLAMSDAPNVAKLIEHYSGTLNSLAAEPNELQHIAGETLEALKRLELKEALRTYYDQHQCAAWTEKTNTDERVNLLTEQDGLWQLSQFSKKAGLSLEQTFSSIEDALNCVTPHAELATAQEASELINAYQTATLASITTPAESTTKLDLEYAVFKLKTFYAQPLDFQLEQAKTGEALEQALSKLLIEHPASFFELGANGFVGLTTNTFGQWSVALFDIQANPLTTLGPLSKKEAVAQFIEHISAPGAICWLEKERFKLIYHGSAAQGLERTGFNFDLVGTQGGMTQGWGVYFSDLLEVAESYQRMFSEPVLVDAEGIEHTPAAIANMMLMHYGITEEQAARVHELLVDHLRTKGVYESLAQLSEQLKRTNSPLYAAIDRLVQEHYTIKPVGQIYSLNIPSNEQFLALHLPLSEQSTFVKNAIEPVIKDFFADWSEAYRADHINAGTTGKNLYDLIALRLGSEGASRLLGDEGIIGARYQDTFNASSYNYVVWDEQLMRGLSAHIPVADEVNDTDVAFPTASPSLIEWAKRRFGDAKAPNGQFAWENFATHFGETKVVDKFGQPIVVYHGTNSKTAIEAFDLDRKSKSANGGSLGQGFYFGSAATADAYAGQRQADPDHFPESGAVYPVYLNLETPLVLIDSERHDGPNTMVREALYLPDNATAQEVRNHLILAGFDGVIYERFNPQGQGVREYMALHPSQIKSALANNGNFSTNNDSVRYSFAGEKAHTADLLALEVAETLLSKKHGNETIYQESGWFVGLDGKWRFEISDDQAELLAFNKEQEVERIRGQARIEHDKDNQLFNATLPIGEKGHIKASGYSEEQALTALARAAFKRQHNLDSVLELETANSGNPLRLSEVLKHPDLLNAYPALKNLRVLFIHDSDSTANATHYAENKLIEINLAQIAEPQQILSSLLHETQHAIQHIENFARGGAPTKALEQSIQYQLEQSAELLDRRITHWRYKNNELIWEAEHKGKLAKNALLYHSMTRLMEYANHDRPSSLFRHIRNESQWLYDPLFQGSEQAGNISRMFYGIPKSGPKRNAAIREIAYQMAMLLRSEIPSEHLKAFKEDERSTRNLVAALERQASKTQKSLKPLTDLERQKREMLMLQANTQYKSAHSIYRALAGEMEARATQARQNLTTEQRAQRIMYRDLDAPESEAIVVFGGLELALPESRLLNMPRFSFAGEHAKTADLNLLEQAQTLLEQGADPEQIRQRTGWFKGSEGRWRFELDDNKAALPDESAWYPISEGDNPVYELSGWLGTHTVTLSEHAAKALGKTTATVAGLLDHGPLFEAYPQLSRIHVRLRKSTGFDFSVRGHFKTGEYPEIELCFNPDMGQDQDIVIKSLLHEIQHAIQEAEGFAQGGSSEDFLGASKQFASDSQNEAFIRYRSLAGEVEARNVEQRYLFSKALRQLIAPEHTEDVQRQAQIIKQGSIAIAQKNEAALDTSESARLARAQSLGFDTSTVWHHGSDAAGFKRFNTDGVTKTNTHETGAFFTTNFKMAASYTKNNDDAPVFTGAEIFNDPSIIDGLEVTEYWAVVDARGHVQFPVEKSAHPTAEAYLEHEEIELDSSDKVETVYSFYHYDTGLIAQYETQTDAIQSLDETEFKSPGIYSVYLRCKDTLVIDWEGNNWDSGPTSTVWECSEDGDFMEFYSQEEADEFMSEHPDWVVKEKQVPQFESTNEAARCARDMGYDSVLIKNVYDTGTHSDGSIEGDVMVVFDPKNIRSTNALFDPALEGESNILFSLSEQAGSQPITFKSTVGIHQAVKRHSYFDGHKLTKAAIAKLSKQAPENKFYQFLKRNARQIMLGADLSLLAKQRLAQLHEQLASGSSTAVIENGLKLEMAALLNAQPSITQKPATDESTLEALIKLDQPLSKQSQEVQEALKLLEIEGIYCVKAGQKQSLFTSAIEAQIEVEALNRVGVQCETLEVSDSVPTHQWLADLADAFGSQRNLQLALFDVGILGALNEAGEGELFNPQTQKDKATSSSSARFIKTKGHDQPSYPLALKDAPGYALDLPFADCKSLLSERIKLQTKAVESNLQALEARQHWIPKGSEALLERNLKAIKEHKATLQAIQAVRLPSDRAMLNWDKPLSAGQCNRLAALIKVSAQEQLTGSAIFHLLAGRYGSNEKAARALNEIGFAGAVSEGKTLLWDSKISRLIDLGNADHGERFHLVAHGSPHLFARFESQFIGTGEGSQAYGHGLYFADNIKTSQFYQEIALNNSMWYEDKLYSTDDLTVEIHRQIDDIPHLSEQDRSEIKHAVLIAISNPYHLEALCDKYEANRAHIAHFAAGMLKVSEAQKKEFFLFPKEGARAINAITEGTFEERLGLTHLESGLWRKVKDSMSDKELQDVLDQHLAEQTNVQEYEETLAKVAALAEEKPDDEFYQSRLRDCRYELRMAQCAKGVLEKYAPFALKRPLGTGGYLYLAECSNEKNQYLRFDLTFSEQELYVQDALNALANTLEGEDKEAFAKSLENNETGEQIHTTLTNLLGKNANTSQAILEAEKETSRRLLQSGIAGIQYLDGASRGDKNGNPSFNYVVFDERSVRILACTDKANASERELDPMPDFLTSKRRFDLLGALG